MYKSKTLFLFILMISCFQSSAAVFTVTSNADSGAGTLRDALTQAAANGTTEKDYINFNLPDLSESGRTITIMTQLPDISSNLVIDGTTQPGSNFGVSNAKIILQPENQDSRFNAFVIVNVSGFELYGLYVRDFLGRNVNAPTTLERAGFSAIYIETSSNIQIGDSGKGNVLSNNGHVIYTNNISITDGRSETASGVNNLKFLSNFVGVEPDGKTLRGDVNWGIDLSYCKGEIDIGGPEVTQRNVINNCLYVISAYYLGGDSYYSTGDKLFTSNFVIGNNYIGYDVNGDPVKIPNPLIYELDAIYFNIYKTPSVNPDYYDCPYTFQILNNKIQYPYTVVATKTTGPITFQGNKLLYEATSATSEKNLSSISFRSNDVIKVGGEGNNDGNTIYGSQFSLYSAKSLLIRRNSIYCVDDPAVWRSLARTGDPDMPLPAVNIGKITPTTVSGTATPLSQVELFEDDDCQYCQPLTYVGTANADADGNWTYSGAVQKGLIASATVNGFTSLFTSVANLNGGANVIHYACGNGGQITGSVFTNTGGYLWKDSNNQTVGNQVDVNNLKPGNYTVTAINGTCSSQFSFTILDATPIINDSNKKITQPVCSEASGSITGIHLDNDNIFKDAFARGIFNVYTYKWTDAGGNVAGTDLDLKNVAAGTYLLGISYLDRCTVNYGPITLKNSNGPNIDQSKQTIKSTLCGQPTGAITNITATGAGTLKYSWLNSQSQVVGTGIDLHNQPAGVYKLQVTDDTQCGPVYSAAILIPETNAVTIDDSKAIVAVASCGLNNGSVTGIQVTGATKYVWNDGTNNTVTTTADLTNIPPGNYVLTASNDFGCSNITRTYHIDRQAPTVFPVYRSVIVPSCYKANNGSVTVTANALVKSLRWVNSNNQNMGTHAALTGVAPGVYQLYLTDQYGCESFYGSYTVDEIDELKVAAQGPVTNDQCGLNNGSIGAATITGGVPPYTYTWNNAEGSAIASTTTLAQLAAGNYTMEVTDSRCGTLVIPYNVGEDTDVIPAPSVPDVSLCGPGLAIIKVSNTISTSSYRIYDSPSGTNVIQEQKGGNFKVNVTGNTSYYITQADGNCESPRTEVHVSVGLSASDIRNAFTPNGDGINDYWQIDKLQSSNNKVNVQVFTRSGQLVFNSIGYSRPFDGTFNGKKLPAGVYYYVINLGTSCKILSGSLTIIR